MRTPHGTPAPIGFGSPQEQFWSGEFGDAYTARNRVDWRARIPFWHDMLKFTGARSVFEVGCGAGWNLSAIRETKLHHVELHGCEINDTAAHQAWTAGLWEIRLGACTLPLQGTELVFTAGLLIHVAPENLPALMKEIVAASTRWVIAVEYASDSEEMVEYRGHKDRLWKRPYGALYEALGMKILHTGDAVGFDRCTYWLMEKP